jgi:hypothetical protein
MIVGLHHVGHVIRDMAEAREACRRMGFSVTPPSFPALPGGPGGTLRAVGAGNAHIPLGRSFLELVTVLGRDGPPDGAVLVPLHVPDGRLDRLAAGIAATTDRLQTALDRSRGLHLVVLTTSDADADAARLALAGTAHRGVQRTRRPGRTSAVPLAVVELDDVPEGRLALAEPLPADAHDPQGLEHPNGAIGLSDVVLCVADAELADVGARYAGYLDRRPRREGPALVFDMPDGQLTVVALSGLDALLPGERPPVLPAFVGCTIEVVDVGRTQDLLHDAGLPVHRTPVGLPFVPASAALGAAVAFGPSR